MQIKEFKLFSFRLKVKLFQKKVGKKMFNYALTTSFHEKQSIFGCPSMAIVCMKTEKNNKLPRGKVVKAMGAQGKKNHVLIPFDCIVAIIEWGNENKSKCKNCLNATVKASHNVARIGQVTR